jgi:hypothetical protein
MRNACVACTFLTVAVLGAGAASAQERAVTRSQATVVKPGLPRSERPVLVQPPPRARPAMPPQAGQRAAPMLTPLAPIQPPVVPPRLVQVREAGVDLKALTQELVTRHGAPPPAVVPAVPRAKVPGVLRELAAQSDGAQKERLLAIAAKLDSGDELAMDGIRQEYQELQTAINTLSHIIKQQNDARNKIIDNIK